MAEPETIATGGIVRIVNGSLLEVTAGSRRGRHAAQSLPTFQIVEYLRAFLAGRAGWCA